MKEGQGREKIMVRMNLTSVHCTLYRNVTMKIYIQLVYTKKKGLKERCRLGTAALPKENRALGKQYALLLEIKKHTSVSIT
jgi:hypothetical protein